MQLLKQTNRWSCLPTAFAMVSGISLDEIIKEIGHDGSEVLWPDLPEPRRRRSFHVQEIIDVMYSHELATIALDICPYAAVASEIHFTEIKKLIKDQLELIKQERVLQTRELLSLGRHFEEMERYTYVAPENFRYTRIGEYLSNNDAILSGRSFRGSPHAVAWDHKEAKINDPNGTIYAIDKFDVAQIYVLKKFNNASDL